MKQYSICMVGFGNVGQAFARLIMRKSEEISHNQNISFIVKAIATGSHGWAIDPNGINLSKALDIADKNGSFEQLSTIDPPERIEDLITASKVDFLMENSPVNYETGEPAVSHIRTALENNMHVVSANKGPVVHAYQSLTELAAENGRQFLFESAVMDGAPVFSVFREALPTAKINSFKGILNSSTNLIIEKMEDGSSFDEAVAFAQAIGIAETDPSGDIDGWDASIKVAALVTVLMGAPLKPQDVRREGIRGLTIEDIQSARKKGSRWKLVCSAKRENGKITSAVAPKSVPSTSPLYSVNGTSSLVIFNTDVLPGLGILESNPSPDTTAYGLLADILNILK